MGAHRSGPRVIVMGGSLGGLAAALWLRDAGCDLQVYERSRPPLEGRGAGIVLHPATVRYFIHCRVTDVARISAPARWLRYANRDGGVAHEQPYRYRFASWTTLYRGLLGCFDRDRYSTGQEVVGFDQDAHGATVHLDSKRRERCDLLVCADGISSTARRLLLPEVTPRYAGYVAWRGTVDELELTRETFAALHEAITYYLMPSSHILAYPIPNVDGSVTPGRRLVNWVWYRNVTEGCELEDLMTDRNGVRQAVSLPPGSVQDRHVLELRRAAATVLPPALADMVLKTVQPFIQVIQDVEVPRMAFGRVCLIGDAAFALRPHAAAGTAKAAEDAWQLAEAVKASGGDILAALKRWEPGQVALGRQILARAREAGNRSQFEGTWRPGDPLPFGLYRVGDSGELEPEGQAADRSGEGDNAQ